jgi:hypothetical protein
MGLCLPSLLILIRSKKNFADGIISVPWKGRDFEVLILFISILVRIPGHFRFLKT